MEIIFIAAGSFIAGAGITLLLASRFYNRKLEKVIQYAAIIIKQQARR
jgi:hypothetical protein